jgi:hypothetical protein
MQLPAILRALAEGLMKRFLLVGFAVCAFVLNFLSFAKLEACRCKLTSRRSE